MIREHFASGRLDALEFEERLQSVYAARTRGELDRLSADLPVLPPAPPTGLERARTAISNNEFARGLLAGGVPFAVCTTIWALTGADSSFWPKWVLVFTVVSALRGARHGVTGDRRARRRSRRHEHRYGESRPASQEPQGAIMSEQPGRGGESLH